MHHQTNSNVWTSSFSPPFFFSFFSLSLVKSSLLSSRGVFPPRFAYCLCLLCVLLRQVSYRRSTGARWTMIIETLRRTICCRKKGISTTRTTIRARWRIPVRNSYRINCSSNSNNSNSNNYSRAPFAAKSIRGCTVYVDTSCNAGTKKRGTSATFARENFTDATGWKNTCWHIIQTWSKDHKGRNLYWITFVER